MDNAGTIQLTRQELYERVWSTPMRTLANEWGLSDVGLAKICKRHQIPRPGVGHWSKKRHGKRVRRAPLPPVADENLKSVTISPEKVDASEFWDPEIAELVRDESDPRRLITVGERIQLRHPIIRSTRDALRGAGTDEYGRMHPRWGYTDLHFDINVSPGQVSRALRILQVLTAELDSRGHVLRKSSCRHAERPCFEVLGKEFEVTIREPSKRSEREE